MSDYSYAPAPEIGELARYELNDFGNAMRFIRLCGGLIDEATYEIDKAQARVLYLRGNGWIAFNGRHWDLEHGEAMAYRMASQMARGLAGQIKHRIDSGAQTGGKSAVDAYKFATESGNSGKISATLKMASNYLDVGIEDFDQDPMSLNVLNGTLRFVRGPDGLGRVVFLGRHDPADRFTRIAKANWIPEARAPVFDGVLAFAQPELDMRTYLQRVMGYCSTGDTSEQKFFVFQGKGGDGKSTIVGAVRETLGSYATIVAIETFLDTGLRRGGEASPDIAALAGDTRLLSSGEPPSGAKLAAGAIKQYTGGGKIKARQLREALFEFAPVGKPLIECNRKPLINDTDDGIWRRLKILLFRKQVPEGQRDGHLPAKLKAEADGILGWLVEGVIGWMNEGLIDPQDVKDAVEDYRRGANPFAQWMQDRLEIGADYKISATELFDDYKAWMDAEGHEKPMSQKGFGAALGDQQIILAGKNAQGKKMRKGARLKPKGGADSYAAARSGEGAVAPDLGPDQGTDEWV